MMRLATPLFLILFIPLIPAVFFYLKNRVGKEGSLRFSTVATVRKAGVRPSPRRILTAILRGAALSLLIIALTRPQTGKGLTEETRFVVDIVISMDVSSSMGTLDFQPQNRLEAAKLAAKKFIQARTNDRIGLVVFAQDGLTQCPLTTDKTALLALVDQIQMGKLEDGTAIGVGLGMAVNRLRESEAKSKVVILLTDGVNNSGEIDPQTAAKIAREFGVRVYTIGVGVEGEALLPMFDPRVGTTRLIKVQTEIDENLMTDIAESTGGRYYRAQNAKTLDEIFAQIDTLEKTQVKVESYTRYEDHYAFFLRLGFFILLAELITVPLFFNKLP